MRARDSPRGGTKERKAPFGAHGARARGAGVPRTHICLAPAPPLPLFNQVLMVLCFFFAGCCALVSDRCSDFILDCSLVSELACLSVASLKISFSILSASFSFCGSLISIAWRVTSLFRRCRFVSFGLIGCSKKESTEPPLLVALFLAALRFVLRIAGANSSSGLVRSNARLPCATGT